MKAFRRLSVLSLVALALPGCPGPMAAPGDAGILADAQVAPDAGRDAAAPRDAGIGDAGLAMPVDGGSDAGTDAFVVPNDAGTDAFVPDDAWADDAWADDAWVAPDMGTDAWVVPVVCGDGTTDTGEVCDDGNTTTETECAYGTASCTACDASCAAILTLSGGTCGDLALHGPQEECDRTGTAPSGLECSACALADIVAPSAGGNASHYGPAGSTDGRFVAFHSRSTNLDARDTTSSYDIYVRDLATLSIELLTVSSDGTAGANGDCVSADMSADGNVVTFHCAATNLDPLDTDGQNDVYAVIRSSGRRVLLSAGTMGTTFADNPRVSGDGRWVAFRTDSSDLTGTGVRQVVLYDLSTDARSVLSVSTAGTLGDGQSAFPSLSADGRYVAFESVATNLVTGDTNGTGDVFVRDRMLGTTARVSVGAGGTEGNGASSRPRISADGRWVAFLSSATNLVTGDTNGVDDVFVRDLTNGTTVRLTVAEDGTTQHTSSSRITAGNVSTTGLAVFVSSSALVAADTNGTADVYVRDLALGTIRLASGTLAGASVGGFGEAPSITADGRFVYFQSNAGSLVTGVSGAHVYRRRL